jgi:hypothetical protein
MNQLRTGEKIRNAVVEVRILSPRPFRINDFQLNASVATAPSVGDFVGTASGSSVHRAQRPLAASQTVQTQQGVSARPQDTSSTQGGVVPTTPVPDVLDSNYSVLPPDPGDPVVGGAGNWSSNPVIGS